MSEPAVASNVSEQQQAVFYSQLAAVRKDEVVGVLLAIFLGGVGAHHFYLRRTGLGILYLIFFWSGVPAVAGLIEAFFMPERVRRFNAEQAQYLAGITGVGPLVPAYLSVPVYSPPGYNAPVGTALASTGTVCPACGAGAPYGVRFCSRCGTAIPA